MPFSSAQEDLVRVSRVDAANPLAAYSEHGFSLDGAEWLSVEHYYQAMKFNDPALREAIRAASDPAQARRIAKKNRNKMRKDWKTLRRVIMTRGVYRKCITHSGVAAALLATGEHRILETSQYDYFWGCGRDLRGDNAYGKVLMQVRERLRQASA